MLNAELVQLEKIGGLNTKELVKNLNVQHSVHTTTTPYVGRMEKLMQINVCLTLPSAKPELIGQLLMKDAAVIEHALLCTIQSVQAMGKLIPTNASSELKNAELEYLEEHGKFFTKENVKHQLKNNSQNNQIWKQQQFNYLL